VKVTFVLPGYSPTPIGGYLVVFRYANELTRHGHQVCVVHGHQTAAPNGFLDASRRRARYYRRRRRYGDGRPNWFDLDRRVTVRLVMDLRERRIPTGDAIFATACDTAPAVASYDDKRGKKLYLIQHYEDWACGKEQVDATWRMPLHKVVSSGWLKSIGVAFGEEERLTHIPYGVELEIFRLDVPMADRHPMRVGMLAHHLPSKGMVYGITALESVRAKLPDVQAVAFGTRSRPTTLPSWIEYVKNPTRQDLARLYNSLSVFVHTSVSEGWGLTGAEALACGSALVAADSGGIRDYVVDRDTALVVPPKDSEALAGALLELLTDDALRSRLASRGCQAIQSFTWERAGNRLHELITKICARPLSHDRDD
jgi:glycosyltransferase involved in cell wall biosynthesis